MSDNAGRPSTPSFTDALAATVRHDPLVKSALAFYVIYAIVQPLLAKLDVSSSFWLLDWLRQRPTLSGELVLLTMILAGLTWRLGEIAARQEQRFWRRIRLAYCCWFLGAVLRPADGIGLRPVQVVLYAFFYILMIRALEGEPHRPPRLLTSAMERLLTWPSVTFFVLGLVAYFFFVPLSVHWEEMIHGAAQTAVNRRDEFYVYTLLDLYLSIRFLVLARGAGSPRWRAIYLVSALPWIFFVLLTDLGFIVGQTTVAWPLASIPRWWAYIAFVAQVVAARLRHHGFSAERDPAESALLHSDELSFIVSARTLTLGVVFPVIHIVATRYELVETPSHGARQALVLVWLVFFGTVALFQHRHLESRAQALWLDRVTLEEDMRASEQDLRLIIERDRASEMVRSSEKKFDLIFASCPYALFVTVLGNGRFLEVNDAFEETFGYGRQEVIGLSHDDLGLWIEPDVVAQLAEAVESESHFEEVEVAFRTRDGKERRGLLSAALIDVDGSRRLLSILHDVTERRQCLEHLESTARLIERTRAVIFEIDAQGRIRSWSHGGETIAGWKAEDVVGTRARDLLMSTGERWTGEIEIAHREGHVIRLLSWSSPVRRPEADSRLVIATPAA